MPTTGLCVFPVLRDGYTWHVVYESLHTEAIVRALHITGLLSAQSATLFNFCLYSEYVYNEYTRKGTHSVVVNTHRSVCVMYITRVYTQIHKSAA